MAEVTAGGRCWIVCMLFIFTCLHANCIIDERNQVIFSQPEYLFEEDVISNNGDEPLPNSVEICYSYLVLAEAFSVNILTFTTDGTAIGELESFLSLLSYICLSFFQMERILYHWFLTSRNLSIQRGCSVL